MMTNLDTVSVKTQNRIKAGALEIYAKKQPLTEEDCLNIADGDTALAGELYEQYTKLYNKIKSGEFNADIFPTKPKG